MIKHKIVYLLLVMLAPLVSANMQLPDPTRPAHYLVEDTEPVFFEEIETNGKISLTLSAIRISATDKTAIVNGKLVRVGDEVSAATVTEINRVSIVVRYENINIIVRLFNNQIKKEYKSEK